MNFVYYSYNFFPQADAESYCATRFASALARAGHQVTVVTMDWPKQVSESTYFALVSDKLDIVRLPFSHHKNSPIKALIWYGHKSQFAVDVPQSVKKVKEQLLKMDHPILITRTHPVVSTMVGLKTCRYAYKWIAHFSDPIPWIGSYSNTLGHRLLKKQEMNIIRRSFGRADGISVTCMHVCKFYKELYGDAFNERKVFMTTHIGDYRLDSRPSSSDNFKSERILLHPGSMFVQRGGRTIANVMNQLARKSYDIKFIQVGEVEGVLHDILVESNNVQIYDTASPEESVRLRKMAKAIFIPDFESNLSYSPFILSKFVYQIMSDKPIVLYSKEDCEMHDYAVHYPEAGIFWAEEGNEESLMNAIIKAMDFDVSMIDRSRIREEFSEKKVVDRFIDSVCQLIPSNGN